jgi:hypothetical protein
MHVMSAVFVETFRFQIGGPLRAEATHLYNFLRGGSNRNARIMKTESNLFGLTRADTPDGTNRKFNLSCTGK